jgi:hypothetical protein
MGSDEPKTKPTRARFALAANVKHLMDNYSKGFAVGLTPVELEKGSGVSAKTIRRIIDPYSDTGPNLETIDQIAAFFRLESWELLRPRPPALAAPWAEVTTPQKSK